VRGVALGLMVMLASRRAIWLPACGIWS